MIATEEKTTDNHCAECGCLLHNVFTGIHVMIKKDARRKIVCGMCAAQLEQKGWVEKTRAK